MNMQILIDNGDKMKAFNLYEKFIINYISN